MNNFVDFSIDNNFNVIMSSSIDNNLNTKHITVDELILLLQAVKDNSTYIQPREKNEGDLIYKSPLYHTRNGVHILNHSIFENNKEIVFLQRKKEKKSIIYYDKNMTINLPELIFRVDIRDNIIRSVFMYASETNLIKEDTELCVPKIPNVYHNGRVCLGSNSLLNKEMTNFMELLSLPDMVLEMPFTHALSGGDAKMSLSKLIDNEMDFGELKRRTTINKIIQGDERDEF